MGKRSPKNRQKNAVPNLFGACQRRARKCICPFERWWLRTGDASGSWAAGPRFRTRICQTEYQRNCLGCFHGIHEVIASSLLEWFRVYCDFKQFGRKKQFFTNRANDIWRNYKSIHDALRSFQSGNRDGNFWKEFYRNFCEKIPFALNPLVSIVLLAKI